MCEQSIFFQLTKMCLIGHWTVRFLLILVGIEIRNFGKKSARDRKILGHTGAVRQRIENQTGFRTLLLRSLLLRSLLLRSLLLRSLLLRSLLLRSFRAVRGWSPRVNLGAHFPENHENLSASKIENDFFWKNFRFFSKKISIFFLKKFCIFFEKILYFFLKKFFIFFLKNFWFFLKKFLIFFCKNFAP